MKPEIQSKIQELVDRYGYDRQVLVDFADFVESSLQNREKPPQQKQQASPPLKLSELKSAVCQAFNCKSYAQLKKNEAFKLATVGRDLDFRTKESWLVLYREWVGVPENEQHEEGETVINGIDVLKNFRPWQVFGLDAQDATTEDIKNAFRRLSKTYHPDVGGNREVFEKLKKMRDSLLAFR